MASEFESALLMSTAMAMLMFGHELSRNSIMALFTSETTGFAKAEVLTLAMSCVSPFSLLLLIWYGKKLHSDGPRLALRKSSLAVALALALSGLILTSLQKQTVQQEEVHNVIGKLWENFEQKLKFLSEKTKPSQLLIFALFVLQNSYSQLLCTQQWSFLTSVIPPKKCATFFSIIAGIASLSSAVAAACVSLLVGLVGLPGLLLLTGAFLLLSVLFSEWAYSNWEQRNAHTGKGTTPAPFHNTTLMHGSLDLIQRVPMLKALLYEVFTCQCLSSLLNVCFVSTITETFPDDEIRAGVYGKFYFLISGISGCLQFGAIPFLMKKVEAKRVWIAMPTIMVFFTSLQCLKHNRSAYLVSAGFFVMKTIEYSVHTVVNNMAYVTLDYESRNFGKQIINVFGFMAGRSCMYLALSVTSTVFGPIPIQTLCLLANMFAFLWMASAYSLCRIVPASTDSKKLE
mmetsp:Transcript_1796/g.2686  ORF Transcript_1796/g.2686 Transcript_1796/m.2686 type:complete len:457 (-) Transcript_1796:178-1548(-)